jgi:TolB-like protein
MRKFFVCAFAILVFSSIAFAESLTPFDKALIKVANDVSNSPNIPQKAKLVVIGFQESSTKQQLLLSSAIEDDLSGNLIKKMPGRIIAKNHIDTVLKELKITREDIFDSKNRKQFGKLLSADYIVTGSYWIADKMVNINIVIVDIENGVAVFSDRIKVKESSFPNDYFRVTNNGSKK